LGRIPDIAAARQRLQERVRNLLNGKQIGAYVKNGIVELWAWDATKKSLVPRPMDELTAASVLASYTAGDLYRMDSASIENRRLYLLAWLEMSKRLSGPDASVTISQLATAIPDLSWEDIDRALADAIDRELYPAAIATAEIAKEMGSVSFVQSAADRPSNLVRALLQGQRHLQFAAADAIAAIDPQQPYAGSSYLMKTMVYLAATRRNPAGLVGDQRPATAQSIAAALSRNGMLGLAASSSRDLFEVATQNPDLDVILVSDSLTHPDYVELAHQLRGDWRTRRTPIGVIVRDENQRYRAGRLTNGIPNLLVMPLSTEPQLVYEQVIRLRHLRGPWPLTNGQRHRHAAVASDWLAKILSDGVTYNFYDAIAYRDQLLELAGGAGNVVSRTQLLANLGTPGSQRALFELVGRDNLLIDERNAAARALAGSIQTHGTLLPREEIRRLCERLNTIVDQDGGASKVISSIIDSIESNAKHNLH
jgi:DNA-binding response OmpR family regulator